MEQYNTVIIGGGIAGLSTALAICKKTNLNLLLIEKSTIGNPTKTSPFTFPDIVERYHLSEAVLQEYTRFTYSSPTGIKASFQYEKPAFTTLDYHKACKLLLSQIPNKNNLQILEKTEALDIENTKLGVKVSLSNHTNILCDILVDASGSHLFAARKLGIKLPTLYSHPYGEFLEECEIEDPEEMCIFSGVKYGNGGGWMYSIDRKTARFGFATVTTSTNYPTEILTRNFKEAMLNFHPYSKMLANAKRKRPEAGTIPIGPLSKFIHGRIIIVGDAAGQATTWYNEGVRPALESGEICGNVIAEAYKNGKLREEKLNRYQQLWDKKNRKPYSQGEKRATKVFLKRTQEDWDNSIKRQASLSPQQMLAIIRYNKWPRSALNIAKQAWRHIRP